MNIVKLANGNLKMTADENEQQDIQELRQLESSEITAEASFICEFLGNDPMGDGVSYEQVSPESVGALTSAPLISDGENVYGYMAYELSNFLEELAAGKTIIWQIEFNFCLTTAGSVVNY